ncbi:hypothetical protein D1872_343110 [compost metagenome]
MEKPATISTPLNKWGMNGISTPPSAVMNGLFLGTMLFQETSVTTRDKDRI